MPGRRPFTSKYVQGTRLGRLLLFAGALAMLGTLIFAATAAAVYDTTPPVLQSFSLSTSTVDVSHGNSETITITARITDDLSGFASGFATLRGPGGQGLGGDQTSGLTRVSGDPLDGVYTATLTVYPDNGGLPAVSGLYYLSVSLQDAVGNAGETTAVGQPVDILFATTGHGPVISNVRADRTAVDISNGPETVNVTATIVDSTGAPFHGQCYFDVTSPSGNENLLPGTDCRLDPTDPSGTGFSEALTFIEHLEQGPWTVSLQASSDGGTTTAPVGTIIVADSSPDVAPPGIGTVQLEPPESVVVSSADGLVTGTVEITDPSPSAGIKYAYIGFVSPSGIAHYGALDGPAGGGSYTGTATIPRYSQPGTWTVVVAAGDYADHETQRLGTFQVKDDNPGGPPAPNTEISSGPEGPTNVSSPSFAYSSTAVGSSFQCKLDGPGPASGSFAPCPAAGTSYSTLADGDYVFAVRATDGAGNTDASPATHGFTVDTVAPSTTATATATGATYASGAWTNDDVSVTLAAMDSGSGVEGIGYSATGTQPIAATTVPGRLVTGLTFTDEGTTTLSFAARDAASNAEATKSLTIRIDRTAPTFGTCEGGPFEVGSGPQAVQIVAADHGGAGLDYAASILSGTVDTSTAGAASVDFKAVDLAGNQTLITCAYDVDPALAAEPTADYRFLGSNESVNTRASAALPASADALDGPPALADVNIHGNRNNAYKKEVADPGGSARSVLVFPQGNGLQLFPASPTVPSGVYTIAMRFRLADTAGRRRLVDFKHGADDTGLYSVDGGLQLSPHDPGPAGAIRPNVYVTVVLTRDAAGMVSGYVNGVAQFRVNDSIDGLGVIDPSNQLRFFRDNDHGAAQGEQSAGAVARIELFDTALKAGAVAALSTDVPAPVIAVDPASAAAGASVQVVGSNFVPGDLVHLSFVQGSSTFDVPPTAAAADGSFVTAVKVPVHASAGNARITATGTWGGTISCIFRVTR